MKSIRSTEDFACGINHTLGNKSSTVDCGVSLRDEKRTTSSLIRSEGVPESVRLWRFLFRWHGGDFINDDLRYLKKNVVTMSGESYKSNMMTEANEQTQKIDIGLSVEQQ